MNDDGGGRDAMHGAQRCHGVEAKICCLGIGFATLTANRRSGDEWKRAESPFFVGFVA